MEYNCLILINIQMCLNVCGHLRFPETRSTTATTINNWKIFAWRVQWLCAKRESSWNQSTKENIWRVPFIPSVQSLSRVRLLAIPWIAARQSSLSSFPSPAPRAYSDSCPLSLSNGNPSILSSVVPFSSHLQSFPASASFTMNQSFALGGQSFGVSASASVLPMNIQDWFPLGLTVC